MVESAVKTKTIQEKNKALVLEAFDTLFNKRDYAKAETFWSPDYIQHSAHIEPGRDGLFNLVSSMPSSLKYESDMVAADGDFVMLHGRFSGMPRTNWIAADVVRVVDGRLVEHWDVLQDEATRQESKSGLPMFGDSFPEVTRALNWEVFVTPGIPIVTADKPPGVLETYFQAMASTLISGIKDAVLVDAFMTVEQANALADWAASKNKNLTTIYITHGHGDHWFGVATLLERFPNARAVATRNTIEVMRRNASPDALRTVWKAAFPDQIPDKLVIAQELEENVIDLEGQDLVAVELGHTDTDHTTCLHVPSIGLVVAGDAAYNDVHLYLAESDVPKRQEWIAALDKIESLSPRAVVASHKRPENDDNPRIIEETQQYIRDFDRLAETTKTAQELYDKMLEFYPNRVNPGWALWSSARAVKS